MPYNSHNLLIDDKEQYSICFAFMGQCEPQKKGHTLSKNVKFTGHLTTYVRNNTKKTNKRFLKYIKGLGQCVYNEKSGHSG